MRVPKPQARKIFEDGHPVWVLVKAHRRYPKAPETRIHPADGDFDELTMEYKIKNLKCKTARLIYYADFDHVYYGQLV